MAGVSLVEVESRERAHELAARVPDAAIEGLGVEVRLLTFGAGGTR